MTASKPTATLTIPLPGGETCELRADQIRRMMPVLGEDDVWYAWLGVWQDGKHREVETSVPWSAAMVAIWAAKRAAEAAG